MATSPAARFIGLVNGPIIAISSNCLAIGQLHALMYRDLAAHFEQVNVLYLAGNHGRRTPKKDYLGAHDNWDYLCGEIARLHCRDLANINFTIPDAWIGQHQYQWCRVSHLAWR